MTEDFSTYQIDPNFPPDKAGEWKTPPKEDTWVLSHHSLRGELKEIEKALVHVVSDPIAWKIAALESMWKYHRGHVLAHHKAEEEIMQPVLSTRFRYPEKVSAASSLLHKYLYRLLSNACDNRRPMGIKILRRMLKSYRSFWRVTGEKSRSSRSKQCFSNMPLPFVSIYKTKRIQLYPCCGLSSHRKNSKPRENGWGPKEDTLARLFTTLVKNDFGTNSCRNGACRSFCGILYLLRR